MLDRSSLSACIALTIGLAAPSAFAAPAVQGGLPVSDVAASSTLATKDAATPDAKHLVDGDAGTWWQPAGSTPRYAWVKITLAEPARVDGLVIHNGNQRVDASGELFTATGRVRTAWALFDDGSAEVVRLDPHRRGGQRLILSRLYLTKTVTLVIRDFEIGERWNHLAISEITVMGRTASAERLPVAGDGAATCGSPGWARLRDAVVRYCGDPARGGTACEDPVLEVVVRCRSDAGAALAPVDWQPEPGRAGVRWSYDGRWFGLEIALDGGAGKAWRVAGLNFVDHSVSGAR